MILNTHSRESTRYRRVFICSLEPPGNVARNVNLYRAELFQRFSLSSARVFPIAVHLLVAAISPKSGMSHRGIKKAEMLAGTVLKTIEDHNLTFSGLHALSANEALYLGLDSGLPELRDHLTLLDDSLSEILCPSEGIIESCPRFLLPGRGFFVCRTDGSGAFPALEELPPPPCLSFRDCSVTSYCVDSADDFTQTTYWTLLAKAKRKTGYGRG